MKIILVSVSFVIANFSLFTNSAIAQDTYPIGLRARFLQGCVTEKPPDFTNEQAVYQQFRLCVCALDQFQARYSSQDFYALISAAEQGDSAKAVELNTFVEEAAFECM
ncbi:MAG: hypothetical protein AAGG02_09995 [Cyanobacteria bacterium P01_H01_bin.15]